MEKIKRDKKYYIFSKLWSGGINNKPHMLEQLLIQLQLLVNGYNEASIQNGRQQQYLSSKLNSKIPNHMTWIVKMWYFGQDALTSYSGEKFDISWEDSLNVFHHIYSKGYGNKKLKMRKEVQEYPNNLWKKPLWAR